MNENVIKKPSQQDFELALNGLAALVWESRWVSDDEAYMDSVGVAAAIRSGNLDEAIEAGKKALDNQN